MTSSGSCHICSKVAHSFHYTRPRKDAFDTHEGYWHCVDHGPNSEEGEKIVEDKRAEDPTYGMNRAQRRALKRKR